VINRVDVGGYRDAKATEVALFLHAVDVHSHLSRVGVLLDVRLAFLLLE
jgi:uncharacterized protein YhjY with autotransporter beta-barrel domain